MLFIFKRIIQGLRRVFIIKLFYKQIKDEDNSILEVYCDNLKRDEIKELLALLEGIKFKYISVDAKSIKIEEILTEVRGEKIIFYSEFRL